MKIVVLIGGKEYPVEIDRGRGEARIGKRVVQFRKQGELLFVNDRPVPYECYRDRTGAPRGILLRGKFIPVETGHDAKKERAAGGGDIFAPLNGQVVKVSAREGETVKSGQVVLTLEAMKMENEIAAPFDGAIRTLKVAEKQVVKAGELLFQLEPLPDA